ncbi:MAG: hypothetical protein N4A33_08765 [Bacteriovoracaceae bacterium]|jgi:hypothetical protein|nr:hypothetical protein [Bacteriovoracaceae bacterium]
MNLKFRFRVKKQSYPIINAVIHKDHVVRGQIIGFDKYSCTFVPENKEDTINLKGTLELESQLKSKKLKAMATVKSYSASTGEIGLEFFEEKSNFLSWNSFFGIIDMLGYSMEKK